MEHIHLQIAHLQQIGRRGRGPPAQRLDPREQLIHRKRFGQIIICAGLETFERDPPLRRARSE